MDEKVDAVPRIDRGEHTRIIEKMQRAGDRDRGEPNHHDRAEQGRNTRGAVRLHSEQRDQNEDRRRND